MRTSRGLDQQLTILSAIIVVALLLVVLQLWLLTATMNAVLGGDTNMTVPAAFASLVCFGVNFGLLRHVHSMGRG